MQVPTYPMPSRQCAAVRIQLGAIRLPPQKWYHLVPERYCKDACHGYSLGSAVAPPTMRDVLPSPSTGMALSSILGYQPMELDTSCTGTAVK